jgi:predicted AlkP superfamily phosphohydrolase/phosphomutase
VDNQQIFDMTAQRFELACYLAASRPWHLFIFFDMGPDRLHHGFWNHSDPAQPRHDPSNPYASLFRDYYRAVDRHLARFIEVLPDNATVLVVSDHGAQPMIGGFCFNEWLQREGLLILAEEPAGPTPIEQAQVDWSRTTAWGDGGYYGRLFPNVEGREPAGSVPPREYRAVREQLIEKLEALTDHRGAPLGTRVFRPEEVYPEARGVPPDLIVYFANLRSRSGGLLGLGEGLYTFHNDTGPDDANHADQGISSSAGRACPSASGPIFPCTTWRPRFSSSSTYVIHPANGERSSHERSPKLPIQASEAVVSAAPAGSGPI